jgi:hypothetical protein
MNGILKAPVLAGLVVSIVTAPVKSPDIPWFATIYSEVNVPNTSIFCTVTVPDIVKLVTVTSPVTFAFTAVKRLSIVAFVAEISVALISKNLNSYTVRFKLPLPDIDLLMFIIQIIYYKYK